MPLPGGPAGTGCALTERAMAPTRPARITTRKIAFICDSSRRARLRQARPELAGLILRHVSGSELRLHARPARADDPGGEGHGCGRERQIVRAAEEEKSLGTRVDGDLAGRLPLESERGEPVGRALRIVVPEAGIRLGSPARVDGAAAAGGGAGTEEERRRGGRGVEDTQGKVVG